jgi:succinoglycan biosynthesis protein ExoL
MARRLLFLSSHRRHKKVADRLLGALAANRKIDLFSFDRGSVDHSVYSDPNITHISLGPMPDGISASRLISLARATWILCRATRRIKDTDTIVLVNTLELLLVLWVCRLTRLPTVYDVADIHVLLIADSFLGRCARWIERMALKRVRLLVVSSPWFYWEYFRHWLKVPNSAVLIENKVGFSPVSQEIRRILSNRIAWNGLLRCQVSAAVLLECLTKSPESLHLSLHGSLDRLGEFGPKLLAQPNCSYTGQYDPESLGSLLSTASFDWGVDYADGKNSQWLLPNRLYEAIAAGIPLIAVAGTATGDVVRRYNIGVVLPECTPQAVIHALEDCHPETYELWLKNMDALKSSALRGNEWTLVCDDVRRWSDLKPLPTQIDVGVVLHPDALRLDARVQNARS